MKHLRKIFFISSAMILFAGTLLAQDGKVNEVFGSKIPLNWKANTKGSTVEVKGDKLVVTPAVQADGTYRGDIGIINPITLQGGKYPIIAIKFKRVGDCTLTFDTNLGAYQGWKGGFTKLAGKDGLDAFYIDITKKPFRRGSDETTSFMISSTDPTAFKSISFKIAGIKYEQEQINSNKISFEVEWIKSFTSVEDLKAFLSVKPN